MSVCRFLRAVLAWFSRSQVPVDGYIWVDPKQSRAPAVRSARSPDADWSPMAVSLSRKH